MAPAEKRATVFKHADILVHPFFALENVRKKGSAYTIINASPEEVLKDYAALRLPKNWRKRIDDLSKEPHAIMILIGIEHMERERGKSGRLSKRMPQKMFEGRFGAKSLGTLSQEYQELIHYAKRKLGKRLVYVTQQMRGNSGHFAKLLAARGLVPAKSLTMAAYGEYLDMCVKSIGTDAMRELLALQTKRWGREAKTVYAFVYEGKSTPKGRHAGFYSIGKDNLTTFELVRESIRTKGNLSMGFVKKRILAKNPERFRDNVKKYNMFTKKDLARRAKQRRGKR